MDNNTNTTATFTKTEAMRRLRLATGIARKRFQLANNAPCEVGERVIKSVIDTKPTTVAEAQAACYPDDDDLVGNDSIKSYARELSVGEVVHIYAYSPCGFGEYELYDVACVWVGNADNEPCLIDSRFLQYDRSDEVWYAMRCRGL